jgi:hypothetical protein
MTDAEESETVHGSPLDERLWMSVRKIVLPFHYGDTELGELELLNVNENSMDVKRRFAAILMYLLIRLIIERCGSRPTPADREELVRSGLASFKVNIRDDGTRFREVVDHVVERKRVMATQDIVVLGSAAIAAILPSPAEDALDSLRPRLMSWLSKW